MGDCAWDKATHGCDHSRARSLNSRDPGRQLAMEAPRRGQDCPMAASKGISGGGGGLSNTDTEMKGVRHKGTADWQWDRHNPARYSHGGGDSVLGRWWPRPGKRPASQGGQSRWDWKDGGNGQRSGGEGPALGTPRSAAESPDGVGAGLPRSPWGSARGPWTVHSEGQPARLPGPKASEPTVCGARRLPPPPAARVQPHLPASWSTAQPL